MTNQNPLKTLQAFLDNPAPTVEESPWAIMTIFRSPRY